MRHCTVYLSDINTSADLHTRLYGSLMLPPYYGRNLDALKDCLTDFREPSEICFIGYNEFAVSLGYYATSFRGAVEAAADENTSLSVLFK